MIMETLKEKIELMNLQRCRGNRSAMLKQIQSDTGHTDDDDDSNFKKWIDLVIAQGEGRFGAADRLRSACGNGLDMTLIQGFIWTCERIGKLERAEYEARMAQR